MRRYLLTLPRLVSFWEGLVPCLRCVWVRRMSGHSDCRLSQVVLLEKVKRIAPLNTSWTATWRSVASCWFCMNTQIWQYSSVHDGAFLLPKSDGAFDVPARWRMDTWKRLTIERNVATLGLAENSPLHSFSTASMQGLLSVSTQTGLWLWIMYGLKCLRDAAMASASNSHGSQVLWWDRNRALKWSDRWSLPWRIT